ncbi:MAG: Asp23/Gls24 family envelope stress response protein [Anaerolineales bacterium]
MPKETTLGTIDISRTAIASMVSSVTTQTYGVVGMSTPSLAEGIAATITRDPRKGVEVTFNPDDSLTIDVYVVLNYGINIGSVANSLIRTLRYRIQQQTHLNVQQVNVHIQGLRMPDSR